MQKTVCIRPMLCAKDWLCEHTCGYANIYGPNVLMTTYPDCSYCLPSSGGPFAFFSQVTTYYFSSLLPWPQTVAIAFPEASCKCQLIRGLLQHCPQPVASRPSRGQAWDVASSGVGPTCRSLPRKGRSWCGNPDKHASKVGGAPRQAHLFPR